MKPARTLTIAFLVAVGLAHALRLLYGWPVVVGTLAIPAWPSALAIIIVVGLAVALAREARVPQGRDERPHN